MDLAVFDRSANGSNGTAGAAGLWAAIVNSSCDAILSQSLDGTVTSWNPAASNLFGYHPEEMIGESIRRLVPSDRHDEEDRILARIRAGERVESYITVLWNKEQRPIDVCLTISPLWDQKGKIIGAATTVRCIAQPKACEALRWRQFVDQAPVAMLVLDRNMVHLACSRRWVELHGTDAGIGRYHYDLFPQVPEHWKEAHRRGLAGETVSADEEEFGRPDGGKQWFRWEVRPWAMSDQTIGGITIMTEDVTDRVLAVRALRESKKRQSFLLSLNDALRTIDEPVEAIAVAAKMLGRKLGAGQVVYAKIDATGECAAITHDWNDGEAAGAFAVHRLDDFHASFIEDLRNGKTVAVSDVRSDPRSCSPEALAIFERGSVAAIITVPFVKNQRLAGVLGVHKRNPHSWKKDEIALAQEVAERTWEAVERGRVSQALRDSEDRLKFALDAGEVGSLEMSLETRKHTASDRALSFFGLPPGMQPSLEDLIACLHPDDRLAVDQSLQRTAETGQPLRIEFRRQLSDGSIQWLDARAERRSVSGRQFIGGLIQDITERVNQKEAVERAAKAKSEFLSNMSHELRTPMHAILSYSDMGLIVLEESETETAKEYLGNIKIAGSRLLELLNDLLDLAKMQSGKMIYKRADANFADVIRHALMEVKPLLAQKCIEVQQDEHGSPAKVHIDATRLIQVLVNLLSNAIKFSTTGKKISIGVNHRMAGNGAEVLRCRVADEGPGIPKGELQSIFGKFVQSSKTKTGAGGTGLGLAICREIVEAHGGTIWAENIEPNGAAFLFDIPLPTAGEDHVLQA